MQCQSHSSLMGFSRTPTPHLPMQERLCVTWEQEICARAQHVPIHAHAHCSFIRDAQAHLHTNVSDHLGYAFAFTLIHARHTSGCCDANASPAPVSSFVLYTSFVPSLLQSLLPKVDAFWGGPACEMKPRKVCLCMGILS